MICKLVKNQRRRHAGNGMNHCVVEILQRRNQSVRNRSRDRDAEAVNQLAIAQFLETRDVVHEMHGVDSQITDHVATVHIPKKTFKLWVRQRITAADCKLGIWFDAVKKRIVQIGMFTIWRRMLGTKATSSVTHVRDLQIN